MKKLSYISIGLIVGLLIGLTSTAYAEDVTAAFSKFIFKVNGQEKPLDADPLVYQGSTYLPVRTVANLLGYDVTYKADSKTIELTQPQAVGQTPSNTPGGVAVQGDPVEKDNYFTPETIKVAIDNKKAIIASRESQILEAEKEFGVNEVTKKEREGLNVMEQELQKLEAIQAGLVPQPTPTP